MTDADLPTVSRRSSPLPAVVMSAVAVAAMILHFADDLNRGIEPGNRASFAGVVILALWLGSLTRLGDGLLASSVALLGSALGTVATCVHFDGRWIILVREHPDGAFASIVILLGLGVSSIGSAFSIMRLLAESLRLRRGEGP